MNREYMHDVMLFGYLDDTAIITLKKKPKKRIKKGESKRRTKTRRWRNAWTGLQS